MRLHNEYSLFRLADAQRRLLYYCFIMAPIAFLVNDQERKGAWKPIQTEGRLCEEQPRGMLFYTLLDIVKNGLELYEALFIITPKALTIPPVHGNMSSIAKLNMVSLTISQYQI